MIVKIYGLFDLMAGVMLVLSHLDIVPWNLSIGSMMYLFIKSYMYKGDIMSMVDFLIGVYFLMMLFGFKSIIAYIFALFLLQKAFVSLK